MSFEAAAAAAAAAASSSSIASGAAVPPRGGPAGGAIGGGANGAGAGFYNGGFYSGYGGAADPRRGCRIFAPSGSSGGKREEPRRRVTYGGAATAPPRPWAISAFSGAGLDAASWSPQISATSPPAPPLGTDFCGHKSTRLVSKVHLGRPKSHVGKRISPVAAAAVRDLVENPGENVHGILDALSERFLGGSEDLSYILRELGNKGEWEKALRSFDWMIMQQKIKGQWSKLASIMISSLGRLGKTEFAQMVFDKAQSAGFGANVYVYSALISAYGRSGKCGTALEVFEAMKKSGCRPNLITYNTVIDACGKGGVDLAKAMGIFREMQAQGVEPDRITYNSLISVCGRGNYWEESQKLFLEMQDRGIEQDIFTYNTLVDAFCKGGQMHLGASVIRTMRKKSVLPNVVTYSTLIDGYAKLGFFDEAVGIYREMKDEGIQPDRVSYNTLLDIYARLGKFDEAETVCREMERAGWKKDIVTYNAFLDSFGKQGKFLEADNLLREMKQQNVAPNLLTYSTLIDAYSKRGLHREAMQLFEEVKSCGLEPDVVLYSTLIDAHCKNGLAEEALGLLEEMVKDGIQPNVVTYNSLIDAYGRKCLMQDGENKERSLSDDSGKKSYMLAASKVFREMQKNGVKPNVVTFSAILNACSHCASVEDASSLLETMRLFDFRVYGVAHGLLMGCRQQVWKESEILFDQISKLGHNTAAAFYNALTDVLWHFQQRYGAQRVVEAAKERHVWDKAWWHSEQQFCLDLHLMSVGAAQAMLHLWLLYIRAFLCQGHGLPRLLSILTGWGKHSKVPGDSAVKRAIEAHLSKIGSPFHVARFNEGRLVSAGHAVEDWLMDTRTHQCLVLRDVRHADGYETCPAL